MDFFDTKNYVKIVKYTVNKQWGGFVWGTIHEVAIGYPEIPSETDKEEYKQFYDLIDNRRGLFLSLFPSTPGQHITLCCVYAHSTTPSVDTMPIGLWRK